MLELNIKRVAAHLVYGSKTQARLMALSLSDNDFGKAWLLYTAARLYAKDKDF
jgi:hypothetical protein